MTNALALPTAQEINVYDSLDERCATEHFLGKNLDEAEAMFRDAPMMYCEDLMHMGPRAFGYYVRALLAYLKSDAAAGDEYSGSSYVDIVELRLDYEANEIGQLVPLLLEGALYVDRHFEKFQFADPETSLERFRAGNALAGIDPEIYGDFDFAGHADIRARLTQLVSRLESIVAAGETDRSQGQRSA